MVVGGTQHSVRSIAAAADRGVDLARRVTLLRLLLPAHSCMAWRTQVLEALEAACAATHPRVPHGLQGLGKATLPAAQVLAQLRRYCSSQVGAGTHR